MKMGKKGIDLLKLWESGKNGKFASISYRCSAGKNTIGWGHQFDSLVCLVFNIGATNFKTSTLLKFLNDGSLDKVPAQFMRWVYAGKVKLKGLENRRFAEINLWNDKVLV